MKRHTNTLFQQLIDFSTIDYLERKFRFENFYHLLSIKYNMRLVITCITTEGGYLESIIKIYSSAN